MRDYHNPIRIAKTLRSGNVDKDMDQQEHSYIADGNVNNTSNLEDHLMISYKTKHIEAEPTRRRE